MEDRQITIDDLLRKIGAMTIQLDIANNRIELLAQELDKLKNEKSLKDE